MLSPKLRIEERFSREISKTFSTKRIVSLLFLGTRAFGLNTNDDSDYDFMLVLDKYDSADTTRIRKIIRKKAFVRVRFDLNFLYLSDIKARGLSNFQIRALSLQFYKYLAYAKLLIGRNIFSDNPIKLTKLTTKRVNGNRIQEFYGRCDMLYFQCQSDEKLYLQLKKYTKDILWFTLCGLGIIQLRDLTLIPYEKILLLAKNGEILSPASYGKFLRLLGSKYNPSNLKTIEHIRREIYSKYLQLYF